MKRCSECNKRFILSSPIPGMCVSCYQRKEEDDAQRMREARQQEEDRIREEAEREKQETRNKFQWLVDMYEDLGKHQAKGLTGVAAHLARAEQCEKYVAEFQAFLVRPGAADCFEIDPSLYVGDSVYVTGFGMCSITQLSQHEIKVDFQKLLDRVSAEGKRCREIADKSEQFLSVLASLPRAEIFVIDDPGEAKHEPATPPQAGNITKRTPIGRAGDFVVVDVETTGLHPGTDEIIELAAIRFLSFEPDRIFHTYVKPRRGLRLEAQAVNGITWDMVESAPYYEQISATFHDFVGDRLSIVAHNLPFDFRFLTASGETGPLVKTKRNYYDTLDLARREYSYYSSYKLVDLCLTILGISVDDMHTAAVDALATGLIYKEICKRRMGI